MNIINLLSSQRGLRGNENEIALAKEIAENEDYSAVKQLVENLQHKDKRIQSDCLKTLYETGYIKPELIAEFYEDFLNLLTSKNNRLVWGSMIAISNITEIKHREIFEHLDVIKRTVDNGSVITIDCGVQIYAGLLKFDAFFDAVDPLLMEQLTLCPIKQLPQYAEKTIASISSKNIEEFKSIINNRFSECEKDSQRKRLQKVLKKLQL